MEEGWCCCAEHESFQIKVNMSKGHSVIFLVSTGQMNSETIGQNSEWKLSRS